MVIWLLRGKSVRYEMNGIGGSGCSLVLDSRVSARHGEIA